MNPDPAQYLPESLRKRFKSPYINAHSIHGLVQQDFYRFLKY